MIDNPRDYELAHYGIKGMKWGIRRKTGSDGLVEKSSEPKEFSEDAAKAKSSGEKARTKGVQSLSNYELRQLNDRLNLEANYSRLTSSGTPESSAAKRGAQVYKGLKKAVEIGNEVYKAYNSPAVKLIRDQVKDARG